MPPVLPPFPSILAQIVAGPNSPLMQTISPVIPPPSQASSPGSGGVSPSRPTNRFGFSPNDTFEDAIRKADSALLKGESFSRDFLVKGEQTNKDEVEANKKERDSIDAMNKASIDEAKIISDYLKLMAQKQTEKQERRLRSINTDVNADPDRMYDTSRGTGAALEPIYFQPKPESVYTPLTKIIEPNFKDDKVLSFSLNKQSPPSTTINVGNGPQGGAGQNPKPVVAEFVYQKHKLVDKGSLAGGYVEQTATPGTEPISVAENIS